MIDEYRDDLFVPQVIHPFVTEQVLVLERVEGERVDDGHALDRGARRASSRARSSAPTSGR